MRTHKFIALVTGAALSLAAVSTGASARPAHGPHGGGGGYVAPHHGGGHGDYRHGRRHGRGGDAAAAVGLGILTLGVLGALSANNDRYQERDGYYYPEYPQGGQYPQAYNGPGQYPQQYQPPYQGQYPQQYPQQYQQPYNGYNNNQYQNANVVYCASKDYRTTWCAVPFRGRVDLYRKRSSASCRHGRDWGLDRGAVWVANGCRAEFVIY